MNAQPNEPPYRPIPFAPGYMVARDGRVARIKPYRVLKVLPFHDVLREASRDAKYRSAVTNPKALDAALVPFPTARWFTPEAERAWLRWHSALSARHVPLCGDVQSGWVRVDIPMDQEGKCLARLMMHGMSVAAHIFCEALDAGNLPR
jgi:hypothetical protein